MGNLIPVKSWPLVHIIDCHYTFIDKLLLESFQTTVGISRVGMSPHTPPPADTHDLTTVHDKTTGIIEKTFILFKHGYINE